MNKKDVLSRDFLHSTARPQVYGRALEVRGDDKSSSDSLYLRYADYPRQTLRTDY